MCRAVNSAPRGRKSSWGKVSSQADAPVIIRKVPTMKTRVVLIGGVIMAFLIIHKAAGQTQSTRSGRSSDPKMAKELIEATLQRAVQRTGRRGANRLLSQGQRSCPRTLSHQPCSGPNAGRSQIESRQGEGRSTGGQIDARCTPRSSGDPLIRTVH